MNSVKAGFAVVLTVVTGSVVLVVMSVFLALWVTNPYWQPLAALGQVVAGVGLLVLSHQIYSLEGKRDESKLVIPTNGAWLEEGLFGNGSLARVQMAVINKGLRDTSLEEAHVRVLDPKPNESWLPLEIQSAHSPKDPALLVRSGTRIRLEGTWPAQASELQGYFARGLEIRLKPVIGKESTYTVRTTPR